MNKQKVILNRRTVLQAMAATAALDLMPRFARAQDSPVPTAADVVDTIKKNLNMEWNNKTYRDTIKAGDPNTPIKGIAVCFMSTLDVIQRAHGQGLNFVLTHEPTFWTDADLIEPIKNDPLYLEKRNFIEKNGMVVFRLHDHWHRYRPEPMLTGMDRLLGWEKYADNPDAPRFYTIPETTLGALGDHVAKSLYSRSVRLVGDPNMPVKTVARGGHTLSGNITAYDKADVDLVSEVREWESVQYTRDMLAAGVKKGLVLLSHEAGEEEGMVNCTAFMKKAMPSMRIEFVATNDRMYLI